MPFLKLVADLTDAEAQRARDAQYYRDTLHDLMDMNARVARRVRQRAVTGGGTDTDTAMASDSIARTIRCTIALAQHMARPPSA